MASPLTQNQESILDRFDEAWNGPTPPRIEDYLAAGSPHQRLALLRELVRIDLERRLAAGEQVRLEESYLQRFPELSADSSAVVTLVRHEFELRRRNEPELKLGEYLKRFPQCQTELLAHLSTLNDNRGGEQQQEAEFTLAASAATELDLRGYELMERLGGGGMGDVYRAGDPALGRDLAVKVMKADLQGHAPAEQRFLREARVTGSLQHPGIVPIYNLGRLSDGRLHYTMRLVRGRTFADILKEEAGRPERLAVLLAIFEKICQAVAYAHSKQVIHRDLKPANVMVGRFGEVQVMDWGLAKLLMAEGEPAQPEAAVEREGTRIYTEVVDTPLEQTRLGREMGTPAYMPPEQALGEWDMVDERADVFALGSILCEILTGQPPYRGRDSLEVLRKAKRGDLTEALACLEGCGAEPPLLGLCRECLAPAQEGRPRNAEQVARRVASYQAEVQERLHRAELERAAALVKAREEHKKRLWMFAAVLLLLAGVAVSTWQMVRARKAESLATDNATEADQNFQLAQQVVDQFFTRVSEKQLRDIPGFQQVRRELLQSALAYYQDFAGRHRQDAKVQAEVARALFRVGALEWELGNSAQAIEAHEQALAILEPLVQAHPSDAKLRLELGKNYGNIGFIRWWEEEGNRKALPWFERAVPIVAELVAENPANLDARKFLAACYDDMGQMRPEVAVEQANAYLRQGMEQRQELVKLAPKEPEYRYLLGGSWINLGLFEAGKDLSLLDCLKNAYSTLDELVRKHPRVFNYRKTLAVVCSNLGDTLSKQGKLQEALPYLRQGREVVDRLARENPDVIDFQLTLANACNNLAGALEKLDKQDEALKEYEEGERVIASLAADHLDNVWLATTLGTLYANHAALLSRRQRYSEALSEYALALKWQWNVDSLYTATQQAAQSMAAVVPRQAAKTLTAQELKFREDFARAAMDFLEKSVARGFKDVAAMRKEKQFDSLRGRSDFQALLKKLASGH